MIVMVDDIKPVRPTPEQIEKCYEQNPSGAGVAWREGGLVKWKKGLNLQEAQDLIAELPMPFVAHFRIPSCGGSVKSLCHPFPINKAVSLALEGETKDYVLFHNGHWGPWKTSMMEATLKMRAKLPVGHWSDSRAMAWMANLYGPGVLDFIDEKVIAFGPEDYEVFGSGWEKVDEVWFSNKMWVHRRLKVEAQTHPFNGGANRGGSDPYHTTPPHSLVPRRVGYETVEDAVEAATKVKESGGTPAEKTFRNGLEIIQGGKTQSEGTEQGEKEVRQGQEGNAGSSSQRVPEVSPHIEMFRWARAINPKVRVPDIKAGEGDFESLDRAARLARLNQGIETIGRL